MTTNTQHTPEVIKMLRVSNCDHRAEEIVTDLLDALRDVLRYYAPQALECDLWTLSGNSQTDTMLRLAREALDKATAR